MFCDYITGPDFSGPMARWTGRTIGSALELVTGNSNEGHGTVCIVDALLPVGWRSVKPRIDLVREGHHGTAKHARRPPYGEAELQFVTLNRAYTASYVCSYLFP